MPKTAPTSAPERLHRIFLEALTCFQQGQIARAQSSFEEVLRIQPKHREALIALGVIAGQTKNPQKALALFDKAIESDPTSAAAFDHRGLALQQLGQRDAALASFDRAITLKADFAEAHFHRGLVLKLLGKLDAAVASYDRAIALKPDYAMAYSNRGVVLRDQNRLDAALASFERAIALKGEYAVTYYNRGLVLKDLDQPDAALASYDRAIALKGDFAEAHLSRGHVLKDLDQPDAALASYERAIGLKADFAEAHFSRGGVLNALQRLDAALASYDRAIALKTDCAEAHFGRGNVLKNLNQLDAALASYDRAIAIQPDYAAAYYNRAFLLLSRGDFARGWTDYEWRWKSKGLPTFKEKRDFGQPLWLGKEPIAGKTILLHGEQGLGDTLQFCRYATLVADLGARVILEAPEPLVNLLAGLAGPSQIVARGSLLPSFDYHCPLLSLPLAFNTDLDSIPGAGRYLAVDAKKVALWQARLGEKVKPRIGLAWSGRVENANDHNRSMLLADLMSHLPDHYQYVSLQNEVRERDRVALESNPSIMHIAANFSDTAAVCECLDLVISVDTSIAHLSAALGKRTWILLPRMSTDWRWLLERDDSPWYPSVKLYRQSTAGDWGGVLARVRADLNAALVDVIR